MMKIKDFNSLEQFFRANKVFSRFGIERIGVFGSFVRGENYNDIDLLLDDRLKYNERMELKRFLEKKLGIPVDIVIKDFAEPIILHRALKEVKYATAA